MKINKGDKIYVASYKHPFKVRSANKRFAICTKPQFGTVLYFIIDLKEGVRGTEDLIFGCGAETDKQCDEMLSRLTSGETEVSYRNRINLDIVRHDKGENDD